MAELFRGRCQREVNGALRPRGSVVQGGVVKRSECREEAEVTSRRVRSNRASGRPTRRACLGRRCGDLFDDVAQLGESASRISSFLAPFGRSGERDRTDAHNPAALAFLDEGDDSKVLRLPVACERG